MTQPAHLKNLSGRLRHRITLTGPPSPEDRNTLGEPIEQAAVEAEVWAEVKTLSGRELVYAQQVTAQAESLVTIRFRPGVDRYKSLRFDGRTLNINAAIDRDNLGVVLELYCSEER